jgi:starvation-inducible DNA-binding protein
MTSTQKIFSQVFANVYALLLKTQNYHWHVSGPNFKPLHLMFEEQYNILFLHVDKIAERMLALGFRVPATLSMLNELKTIRDGDSSLSAQEMLVNLTKDYVALIENIDDLLKDAQSHHDEASLSMFSDILVEYEKILWMLKASSGGS